MAGAVSGVHETGSDCVDPNPARREFEGSHLGEHRQPRFGCTVCTHPGCGLATVQRTDRYQRAAVPGARRGVLHDQKSAGEADVDDGAELVGGQLGDQAKTAEPGGIHDNVERVAFLKDPLHGIFIADLDSGSGVGWPSSAATACAPWLLRSATVT